MHRRRREEEISLLTKLLRERTFPQSFYGLLQDRGIDPARTVLADCDEDQGCCLSGTLLTADGRVIVFDLEFDGDSYGAWERWGSVRSMNEWAESDLVRLRPKQGSPVEVAAKLLRAGRL